MKIYVHRYDHEPLRGKRLSGALLRVQRGIWNTGFADLHPWPEFSDLSVPEQLEGLANGHPSPLVAKSLYFADQDARARRQRRNLLHGLDLPLSHALVSLNDGDIQRAQALGFWHFKAKVGFDLANETAFLLRWPQLRWRLDFGGRLTAEEFRNWWLAHDWRSRIDVIEDPWRGEDGQIAAPCYSDWIANPNWRGKVFKPARDVVEGRYSQVMFTHNLDHPLGQVAAIWEAAKFYRRYPQLRQPCGFSSNETFQGFEWAHQGPRLRPPAGFGFGFDERLATLKWERII